MANYTGLQAVFNALAGGGANAVNIYAQEKDRQRRLEFDREKMEADRAYRQQSLEQGNRRLDLTEAGMEADQAYRQQALAVNERKTDLLERTYEDEQELLRKQERKQAFSALQGQAGQLAANKGYTDTQSFYRNDPDALPSLNQAAQIYFGDALGGKQIKLEVDGKGKDGSDKYRIFVDDGNGGYTPFAKNITRDFLSGFINKETAALGIPDYLKQAGLSTARAKDGSVVIVDDQTGSPDISPEQSQVVDAIRQQVEPTTGEPIEQTLANPPSEQIKQVVAGQQQSEQPHQQAPELMPNQTPFTQETLPPSPREEHPYSLKSIMERRLRSPVASNVVTDDGLRAQMSPEEAAGHYDSPQSEAGRRLRDRQLTRDENARRGNRRTLSDIGDFVTAVPDKVADTVAEEYGKGNSAAEGAGRVVRRTALGTVDAVKDGAGTIKDAVTEHVTDPAGKFISAVMGDTQEASATAAPTDDTPPTTPQTTTPSGKKVPPFTSNERASQYRNNPKLDNERSAIVFANQMLAAGGPEAMADPNIQKIYQGILAGDASAKAASFSSTLAGADSKSTKNYRDHFEAIREQLDPHIEAQAQLLEAGNEDKEGFKNRVDTNAAGIRDTIYSMSNEFANMGIDINRLSRHQETYADIAKVSARYFDAKRRAIASNKNLGWFGTTDEAPNMTNYMLKTITQQFPTTAERMAISQVFSQYPDLSDAELAKRSTALLEQWRTQKTFMDEDFNE